MTSTILVGDCRDLLKTLEPGSVHCVVTSPPYWSLRDYGTATWEGGSETCDHMMPPGGGTQASGLGERCSQENIERKVEVRRQQYRDTCGKCGARRIDNQLGLEAQLDCLGAFTGNPCGACWICHMVEVFAGVWRVLRDDGTAWVNVGSSYFGGTPATSERTAKQVTNRGSFFSDDTRQNQSPHARRALPCGTDDRAPGDCPGLGFAYSGLCDGCLADFLNHRDRTLRTPQPAGQDGPHCAPTDRDSEQMDYDSVTPAVASPCALVSTMLVSWLRLRGGCSRCENRAALASPSVLHSSLRSSQAFAHMRAGLTSLHSTSASMPGPDRNTDDIAAIVGAWGFHTAGKDADLCSCLYCTTEYHHARLKPKDLCLQPARLALALQAAGWYVRSHIIWHKPAPMPESVRDRPTSAHETVWLLSKRERYYYDQEAVRESAEYGRRTWTSVDGNLAGVGKNGTRGHATVKGSDPSVGRNLRNVWTINTEPLKGVAVYGTRRTVSPDCPVHGCRAGLGCAPECDARLAASRFARNPGTDSRPVLEQEHGLPSKPEYPCASPSDDCAATLRNTQTRKTDEPLMQHGTSDAVNPCRSGCIEPLSSDCATHDCTYDNTEPAPVGPPIDAGLWEQIDTRTGCTSEPPVLPCAAPHANDSSMRENRSERLSDVTERDCRIEDIPSLETPPDGCTCKYTRYRAKDIDHYAAYPTALVRPCILAGTSAVGCCPHCGAGWRRVVERRGGTVGKSWHSHEDDGGKGMSQYSGLSGGVGNARNGNGEHYTVKELGWQPGCDCPHTREEVRPALVLDPFTGSGTTGIVAAQYGRSFVGIELSPAYAEMARKRLAPVIAQPCLEVSP